MIHTLTIHTLTIHILMIHTFTFHTLTFYTLTISNGKREQHDFENLFGNGDFVKLGTYGDPLN